MNGRDSNNVYVRAFIGFLLTEVVEPSVTSYQLKGTNYLLNICSLLGRRITPDKPTHIR